jgi:hypothetical protein
MFDLQLPGHPDPSRFTRIALYLCDHLVTFDTAHASRECPRGHRDPGVLVRHWDFTPCDGCGCALLYLGRRPATPCRGDRRHGSHEAKLHAVSCGGCGRDLLAWPSDGLPAPCSGSGDHRSAVPSATFMR